MDYGFIPFFIFLIVFVVVLLGAVWLRAKSDGPLIDLSDPWNKSQPTPRLMIAKKTSSQIVWGTGTVTNIESGIPRFLIVLGLLLLANIVTFLFSIIRKNWSYLWNLSLDDFIKPQQSSTSVSSSVQQPRRYYGPGQVFTQPSPAGSSGSTGNFKFNYHVSEPEIVTTYTMTFYHGTKTLQNAKDIFINNRWKINQGMLGVHMTPNFNFAISYSLYIGAIIQLQIDPNVRLRKRSNDDYFALIPKSQLSSNNSNRYFRIEGVTPIRILDSYGNDLRISKFNF